MNKYYAHFEDNGSVIVVNLQDLNITVTYDNKEEFMQQMMKKTCEIFIHELGYNGAFISYYLNNLGYTHVPVYGDLNKLEPKQYQKLSSDTGGIYNIRIRRTKSVQIKITDSSKLIALDIIKLKKVVPKGTPDCLVIPMLLKELHNNGHTKMTMGANAFKSFIDITFKGNYFKFRDLFPQLPLDIDEYIRKSYKGGWCYINPEYQGKRLSGVKGLTLDVNSLFPSVMYNSRLPWGEPVYFKGEYKEDTKYPLYISKVILKDVMLKNGKVPCLSNPEDVGYLEEIDYIEVTLTSVELDLIKECYYADIEFIDGYKFKSCKGMFKDYIDFYMDKKINASNSVERFIAKMFLNSLYGKFGTQVVRHKMDFIINSKGMEQRIATKETYTTKMYYTAMASFISAYAKCVTVRGANNNFNRFIYADTDSLHLIGTKEDVIGLEIDNSKLGAWKIERNFRDSKFLGVKTYMELEEGKEEWEVRCAGLPYVAQLAIKDPSEFEYEKEINVQVRQKVAGGATVVNRTFVISKNVV